MKDNYDVVFEDKESAGAFFFGEAADDLDTLFAIPEGVDVYRKAIVTKGWKRIATLPQETEEEMA